MPYRTIIYYTDILWGRGDAIEERYGREESIYFYDQKQLQ